MHRFLIFTCSLALAGCSLAASAPSVVPSLAGFEGLSVVGTKKTLKDHLVSFSTGKDCSTIRKERGQTYCVEDEITTPEEIYCYNTLGAINCFGEPQDYAPDVKMVGHTPLRADQPR